jgi:hypothetical protein
MSNFTAAPLQRSEGYPKVALTEDLTVVDWVSLNYAII